MKILLVNQTFYPDSVATAQHLTDLAIALKKSGHNVSVLTSRCGYSAPYPNYPASEVYQGIQIVRVWPFMFGRKYKLIRTVDALCVNLAFFFRMLFFSRVDTIIALTSPPLVSFFACIAANIKKIKLIYWVMDMNPDEAIAMGWLKENSWIAKGLKWCQAQVVKRSNRIVVLDRYMSERIAIYSQSNKVMCTSAQLKVVVVPPWAHDNDLKVIAHAENSFRKKHELDGKFVVMYSGNHSICHPLETVLNAARQMAEDESVVFVFIGGGARVNEVTNFKRKNNLKNIIQLNYVDRTEIKDSLSAADLHLVVMGDNMAGIVHPCKVYGIIALGRPFAYVGPQVSHVADLLREGARGWLIRHGLADQLVEVIHQVQNMSAKDLEDIRRVNQQIAQRFSASSLILKMLGVISQQ